MGSITSITSITSTEEDLMLLTVMLPIKR